MGAKQFLHCSTAYAEDERNPYEVSKMAAEGLVAHSGMAFSIFRPSAMVGRSETGFTTDFNGYYGVYDYFHLTAEKARGENAGMIVHMPVYVVCSSSFTINLITLDWVAYTMSALLREEARNEIYHLTHHDPPNVRWVMEKGFEVLKISGIRYLEKPLASPPL